jgi:hypothetical protein
MQTNWRSGTFAPNLGRRDQLCFFPKADIPNNYADGGFARYLLTFLMFSRKPTFVR